MLTVSGCQEPERLLAVTVDLSTNDTPPPFATIELTMRSTSNAPKTVVYTGAPQITLPALFGLHVATSVRGQLTLSAVARTDETPARTFRGLASVRLVDAVPDVPFAVDLLLSAAP